MIGDLPRLEDLPLGAGPGCSCAPTSTCPSTTASSTDDLRIRRRGRRSRGCASRAPRSCCARTSAARRARPTRGTRWPRWRTGWARCSTPTSCWPPRRSGPGPPRWPRASGRRRAAAGEPALRPGRDRQRRRLRRPRSARSGDAYVDDAFGAAHRAHASIVGPPARLPSAAGRLLAREVEVLGGLLALALPAVRRHPRRGQGERQARRDRRLAGALRHAARRRGDGLHLPGRPGSPGGRQPGGGRPGRALRPAAARAGASSCRPTSWPPRRCGPARRPDTSARARSPTAGWASTSAPRPPATYVDRVAEAATVLWNGPMGVFEIEEFAAGTRTVAEAVADCRGFTVVGGATPRPRCAASASPSGSTT